MLWCPLLPKYASVVLLYSHMIQMKELPPSDNLCQTYIAHFQRMLQRKAVIMAKFLVDNLLPGLK